MLNRVFFLDGVLVFAHVIKNKLQISSFVIDGSILPVSVGKKNKNAQKHYCLTCLKYFHMHFCAVVPKIRPDNTVLAGCFKVTWLVPVLVLDLMMRQHNDSSPRGHIVPGFLVNLDKWIPVDQLHLT